MNPTQHLWKRLEARIALALSQAKVAAAGIASLSHHVSITNAATIGPAATLVFNSPAFVARSGVVLVSFQGTVFGGTMAAEDVVSAQPLRDGALYIAPSFVGPYSNVSNGTTIGSFGHAGTFIDTVVPGSSHTWGLQIAIPGGHTAQIGAQTALVTILELPG